MYSLTGDGISQKLIELSEISSSASEIDGVVDLKIVTNKLDWTLSRTGYLIGDSATNSNVTYQYNSGYIPVEEGNIVRLYFRQEKAHLTLRVVSMYDENKIVVSTTTQNVQSATIPSGVSYIRLCWYASQSTYQYQDMQVTLDGKFHTYEDNNSYISRVGKESLKRLDGMKVLVYGDSMSDEDDWQNFFKVYSGVSDVATMAIGGANIAISSTRDETTDPYDWRTDFSIGMTDTYNDRHLIPQIIHTPNTLRHKYGITMNSKYLTKLGKYIYEPDAVIFFIGFNDWKYATTYETYAEVKDLTTAELKTRIDNSAITTKKVLTYLRYVIEKLRAGEITETQDGLTYGVNASLSKIYFITPIQSVYPSITTFTLKDFGDYINELLEDYSIERIDGYRELGISARYEINGSAGKFLMDGIHPNKIGNNRIGKMVASRLENTLVY